MISFKFLDFIIKYLTCVFNSDIGRMWIVMKEGALGSNAPSFLLF